MDKIANAATDGGSGGFIAKGQSLYEVFLNRSYSCTVEALGNPMIQPLQYFELENVPMFYGSYLIRDVKNKFYKLFLFILSIAHQLIFYFLRSIF